ncbi:hypothetical protein SAMN02799624_00632 [Paenibacillus sp. UNC496MF]|uniref:hypothetical protein n=1 Tax=Paenibacillus sp. UNC496MF TaxID=1502753 RepID=UPI0008E62C78|nr:hypothetical protein [Paenibacillus sp. UNC496MF]SFI36790.1 hypothetical protein SAMN02799624_00632 [Paenibacillus sp. UNC496MF]
MKPSEQFTVDSLDQLLSIAGKSCDFSRIGAEAGPNRLTLSFYPFLTDAGELHDNLLPALQRIEAPVRAWPDLAKWLPYDDVAPEKEPARTLGLHAHSSRVDASVRAAVALARGGLRLRRGRLARGRRGRRTAQSIGASRRERAAVRLRSSARAGGVRA